MLVKNSTPLPCGSGITSLQPPHLRIALALRGQFRVTPSELTEPAGIPFLAQGANRGDRCDDDERRRMLRCSSDDLAYAKLDAEVFVRGVGDMPSDDAISERPVELHSRAYRGHEEVEVLHCR